MRTMLPRAVRPSRPEWALIGITAIWGGTFLAVHIAVSAPHGSHVVDRLGALDLLVVADLVMSETAALADVVLPVTQWAEETGTMTNLEGRVVLREQAVAPPDGVWTSMTESVRRPSAEPVPSSLRWAGVRSSRESDPTSR